VPEEFFLKPEEKAFEWPIRVTFLGVLHPDKGIKEAIRLFTALRNDSRFRFTIYATYDPHSAHQRQIHEWLLRQDGLIYVPMERNICWTPELEQRVQSVLAETDIFIQPFRSLQNTVDTPLLVLEAMASLCIVLTTPIGSISEIYGKSPFIIPYQHFVEKAIALLKGIDEDRLLKERLRIYRRNEEVRFSQPEIARKFLTRLKEEGEL
jgi:glycosyltransferase involved in cell wall biosynthesis